MPVFRLNADNASNHPTFERSRILKPKDLQWEHDSHVHHKCSRKGPLLAGPLDWAKYGSIQGLLQGLAEYPVEGNVLVYVAPESYEVSGFVKCYDPRRLRIVAKMFRLLRAVAQDLHAGGNVRVNITLTQSIKKVRGGKLVP